MALTGQGDEPEFSEGTDSGRYDRVELIHEDQLIDPHCRFAVVHRAAVQGSTGRTPEQQAADDRVREAISSLLAAYGVDYTVTGDAVLVIAEPWHDDAGHAGTELRRIALGDTPHARALGLLGVAGRPMELDAKRWLGL